MTSEDERVALRATFDRVADRYHGRRPQLPPEVFDEFASLGGLHKGARLLEVGCGTGTATVELARRGFSVTAVELGENLADEARRNLRPYPRTTVITGNFEEYPVEDDAFDAVVAAGSWHWLDPRLRTDQAARALRSGGVLAIVDGRHVAGGDTAFFNDAQRCYEAHAPGTPPGFTLPQPKDVPSNDWRLSNDDRFSDVRFRRWVTVTDYTTETYLSLIRTFSGHIALSAQNQAALEECLLDLLQRSYAGSIRRAVLVEMCVARRV